MLATKINSLQIDQYQMQLYKLQVLSAGEGRGLFIRKTRWLQVLLSFCMCVPTKKMIVYGTVSFFVGIS